MEPNCRKLLTITRYFSLIDTKQGNIRKNIVLSAKSFAKRENARIFRLGAAAGDVTKPPITSQLVGSFFENFRNEIKDGTS